MARLAAILICMVFIFSNPAIAGEVKSVTLGVERMTCKLCPPMVKKALSDVKGVKNVHVDFEKKEAYVQYEDGVVKPEELIKTIDKAGFKAKIGNGAGK